MFLKSSSNPDKKPPNRLKFKLKDIHVFGMVGMTSLGAVKPTKLKTSPIIVVRIKPQNTAAGTLRI